MYHKRRGTLPRNETLGRHLYIMPSFGVIQQTPKPCPPCRPYQLTFWHHLRRLVLDAWQVLTKPQVLTQSVQSVGRRS